MKTVLCIILSLVTLLLLLGCDSECPECPEDEESTPEARLVKSRDGAGFHLQWDKPLANPRIIALQMTYTRWIDVVDVIEDPTDLTVHTVQKFIYFYEGEFRSGFLPNTVRRRTYVGALTTSIIIEVDKVEILPADHRKLIPVPGFAWEANNVQFREFDFVSQGDSLARESALEGKPHLSIYDEHPFFPYKVGTPSQITFE